MIRSEYSRRRQLLAATASSPGHGTTGTHSLTIHIQCHKSSGGRQGMVVGTRKERAG